jgi:5-methylcytosine-specific restriction endonuclease McrA
MGEGAVVINGREPGHRNGHDPAVRGNGDGRDPSDAADAEGEVAVAAARRLTRGRVLVLNASYEPLNVCTVRRALVLLLKEKAEVLEHGDGVLRSETMRLDRPEVIRLVSFVRVPRDIHRRRITRKAVLARDGWTCQYCGTSKPSLTVDHVIPRSRGGEHVWDNVVSCCRRCNHAKADLQIAELGWRLRTVPRAPTGPAWRVLGTGRMHPSWRDYLPGVDLEEPATA